MARAECCGVRRYPHSKLIQIVQPRAESRLSRLSCLRRLAGADHLIAERFAWGWRRSDRPACKRVQSVIADRRRGHAPLQLPPWVRLAGPPIEMAPGVPGGGAVNTSARDTLSASVLPRALVRVAGRISAERRGGAGHAVADADEAQRPVALAAVGDPTGAGSHLTGLVQIRALAEAARIVAGARQGRRSAAARAARRAAAGGAA